MSENLTWKDENGIITTRATKAKLAERLYKTETFLRLCLCCKLEKYHVSICARQMKSPHVLKDSGLKEFYRNDLIKQTRNYALALKKRDNMLAVLTKGVKEESIQYAGIERRPLSREQAERLIAVLRDNGIEQDECLTVAEAICYVTDLDGTILAGSCAAVSGGGE